MNKARDTLPVIELMDQVLLPVNGGQHGAILQSIIRVTDPAHASYIAGFFDGEGHANIRTNKRGINTFKTVHVNLGQNSLPVLEWIDFFYRGTFYTYKAKEGKLKKDFYQWTLTGTRAVAFLRDIYPYLIVKKSQVDQVILGKYACTLQENAA